MKTRDRARPFALKIIHIALIPMMLTGSCCAAPVNRPVAGPATASQAVNELGMDLLSRGTAAGDNAVLSPYSIQSALAMTFAGADGETRTEMARVLHFPSDESELHESFSALRKSLDSLVQSSAANTERERKYGSAAEPLTLAVANRLFGQQGYEFREPFLTLTRERYGAPFQPMDFATDWENARQAINQWVEQQTRQRIRDLIPPDGVDRDTRLALVNAIYLKVPWAEPFQESATKPEPFHVKGGAGVPVPTMSHKAFFGYQHRDGVTVVTITYSARDLQFLIVLPDDVDGLPAVEAKLDAGQLAAFARTPTEEIILHVPKFKLEPPVMRLGTALQSLGMKSAFDKPRGSANFDRMAPRRPDKYLRLSEVFHKTFLSVDEKGTEAAAATAAIMMQTTAIGRISAKPIEVAVDHPFLFAVQQRSTGACLFLGRVVDPR
jgi:serpin B